MAGAEKNDLPDEVLVMAAILGDIGAFDRLALRYRRAVVRVAQTIVGAELAEDVAQEALLTAFKALPTLDEPRKFPAWLHIITRHKALRFSRQERNLNERMAPLDHLLLERSASLSQPMLDGQADRREELKHAVEQLPPEFSLVIKLRFYDDMPVKRIAEFLMLPLTTVKWRLHKGKQLLKETLLENGGHHGKGERT